MSAPAHDPSARVILDGRSAVSGVSFNLAVAFEPSDDGGPAIAQSTFHHFCDYNWDIERGAPSFVSERPGSGMQHFPEALRSTKQYVRKVMNSYKRYVEIYGNGAPSGGIRPEP